MAIIELNNIHKKFGNNKVLNGVNLSIEKGLSVAILGGSGSGKSVLIKTIIGLMKQDSGQVKILGQDTSKISKPQYNDILKNCGFLFQGGALFDSLKIWKNISFEPYQDGSLSKEECLHLAYEKLEQVGLSKEVAHLYPAELSGGMQKRAALARAIACNPEIIFFDEPTTGLDPVMSAVIDNLIINCAKNLGATNVIITHDLRTVERVADKVAMLHNGEIIWFDDANKLHKSGNETVEAFVNPR